MVKRWNSTLPPCGTETISKNEAFRKGVRIVDGDDERDNWKEIDLSSNAIEMKHRPNIIIFLMVMEIQIPKIRILT